MLKLAPQFEHCWKPTTSSRQALEAEIAGAWGRNGRLVTVHRPSRAQHLCEAEALVEARTSSWERAVVVHHGWRGKRLFSCKRSKHCARQGVRGALREGLVLMPVSYTASPVLETDERGPSHVVVVGDKERLMNAFVASTPLLVSGDEDASRMRNVPLEGNENRASGSGSERPSARMAVNGGRKVEWRPPVERLPTACEMQQKSADWSSSRRNHLRQLEEKILLLESVDIDTAKVMLMCPSVTNVAIEDLKALLYYLESCRLKRGDLGRILSMTPQILVCSLEKQLRPVVRFLLKEVGLRKVDLRKVINRCPRLLVANVDSQLRPTLRFLQSLGFHRMASLICSNATLLTFGIQSKLLPKLHFLQSLGFSRVEAVSLVLRFPAIFNYGVDQNLRPKFDYFINTMGGDLDQLKDFPQFFGYSLTNRIQPRYEFLRERNLRVPLSLLSRLSDEEFYSRFKAAQVMGTVLERELTAVTKPLSKDSRVDSGIAAMLESQTDSAGESPKLIQVKDPRVVANCERFPTRVGV